jgi:membrane-bound lytic murein transglycosylase MltF
MIIILTLSVFAATTFASPDTKHDELLKNTIFTGDFDKMNSRHIIRALVVYNDMFYFFDQGHTRGMSYEGMKIFEKFVNKKLKKGTIKIRVFFIPTTRDRIIGDLISGRGDIAAANLTITPKRLGQVDFSEPYAKNVKEVLVTNKKSAALTKLEDLSGKTITVRHSSSYYEHLQNLNQRLIKEGLKKIILKPAEKYLEDADLLEMVNSDILPWAVVDLHKAKFWVGIYDNLSVREDLTIHSGGQIAWAFRKNSPKLKKIVNQFVKTHRQGTLMGNILSKRYLKNNHWVKNPNREEDRKRFAQTVKLFKENAKQFHFDYLMLMALAFQESQLDQKKRSPAGAIGIMQVLKSTAADPKVGVTKIEKIENNINAGTKYLRFIYDNYYADKQNMDDLNKMLFSFASYNAGPRKISKMRALAKKMGLNENIWFANVEVAAAKRIGRETVQYVGNIYKYYIAYRLTQEHLAEKQKVTK